MLLFAVSSVSASSPVNRWERGFRPAGAPNASTPLASRELVDGSVEVATKDSSGAERFPGVTVSRFDHDGNRLSATALDVPFETDKVAIDPFGFVFVAAMAPQPLPTVDAFYLWLMKYDGVTGRALWNAPVQFLPNGGSSGASSILFDARGDLIVTILAGGIYLAKYSAATGEALWPAQAIPGSTSTRVVTALDHGVDIYVTVHRNSFDTFKYSGFYGTPIWGPVSAKHPVANDLCASAVDSSGNLTVAAFQNSTPSSLIVTIYKLSQTGTLLWGPIDYTGPGGGSLSTISLDATGNVLVFAQATDNVAVLKLSASSGGLIWGPKKSPGRIDFGGPISFVAGNGDFVVASAVFDGPGFDLAAWRFDGNTGATAWGPSIFPSVAVSTLPPVALLGSNGRLFLAAAVAPGNMEVAELRGDTGDAAWGPTQFTAATAGIASLESLATAPDGSVVVTGEAFVLGSPSAVATLEYDRASGSTLWGPVTLGAADAAYSAIQVQVDNAGAVFVLGEVGSVAVRGAVVIKYSGLDGSVIWGPIVIPSVRPSHLALDAAGNALILGTSGRPAHVVAAKVGGGSGNVVWGPVLASSGTLGDTAVAIAADSAGDVLVVANESSSGRWIIEKYSGSTGTLQWGPIVNTGTGASAGAAALLLDSSGNAVVTGGDGAIVTVKYAGATGAVLWGPVHVSASPNGSGNALANAPGGDVFVSGTVEGLDTGLDIAALRLRGTDGSLVWGPSEFDGPGHNEDFPFALGAGVDAAGNFIVSGTTRSVGGSTDLLLLKYDGGGGGLLWGPVLAGGNEDEELVGFSVRDTSIVVGGYRRSSFFTAGFDEALGIETRSQDLPLLVCDQAVATPLVAENGVTPYDWTISSGNLPAGLTLSSAGILSGETTDTGVFSFQAHVEDTASASATRDFQILVEDAGDPVLVAASFQVCGELLQTLDPFAAYRWLPGGETTPTIIVAPPETTTYGVIVTDAFGCVLRGSVVVPANTSSPSCGAPVLESLSPGSGSASGGTEVTLFGQNFQPGITVRFGEIPATVVASNSSQVTVSVPAIAPGLSYDVTVRNPDGKTAGLPKGWFSDFLDVEPTSLYHDPIVLVARNGVSGGCGSGKYCPDDPLLRSQSAIFLLKASLGPLYAPRPATGFLFSDVPAGSFAADWIEDLSRRGITTGCSASPPLFCPDATVSRAQLAPLLLRTKLGSEYVPPSATGSIFADVPADGFAAKWIEDLYTRHLTGGCAQSPLRYCPDMIVSRGELAAFLVRTFNLR